tara:strand:- start:127 stop:672 length:546 start_codon:yes stop_codon:yes gene_type:complete
MSAYLVQPEHIAEICKWAFSGRVHIDNPHCWNMVEHREIKCGFDKSLEAHTAAEILARGNIESIEARYPDSPDMLQDDLIDVAVGLSRKVGRHQLSAADIYNMCLCLDYQSCEVENWVTKDAYWLIRAIMAKASRVMASALRAQISWEFDNEQWKTLQRERRDKHNAAWQEHLKQRQEALS